MDKAKTPLTRNLELSAIKELHLWVVSERNGMTGGAEGNRTPDLLIANEALSQLSYSPIP
jgi:hypothetical protein